MKLDVGCGKKPKGNINIDIQNYKANNFIKADAQYLPLRNVQFEKIYCSHVIGHVKNPYKLLRELMRLFKKNGTVYLSLLHRFSYGTKYKGHIHFFTRRWFKENLKYPFECSVTYWSPFKFFLFFPNEIQLKILKR